MRVGGHLPASGAGAIVEPSMRAVNARAGASEWRIGGAGGARRPILFSFSAQSDCGVLTASKSTAVRWTFGLSWMVSKRRQSVKPRIAASAPS